MTYDEACETTLTRSQVIAEILDHNLSPSDFFYDTYDKSNVWKHLKDEYSGKELLDWLGY